MEMSNKFKLPTLEQKIVIKDVERLTCVSNMFFARLGVWAIV